MIREKYLSPLEALKDSSEQGRGVLREMPKMQDTYSSNAEGQ